MKFDPNFEIYSKMDIDQLFDLKLDNYYYWNVYKYLTDDLVSWNYNTDWLIEIYKIKTMYSNYYISNSELIYIIKYFEFQIGDCNYWKSPIYYTPFIISKGLYRFNNNGCWSTNTGKIIDVSEIDNNLMIRKNCECSDEHCCISMMGYAVDLHSILTNKIPINIEIDYHPICKQYNDITKYSSVGNYVIQTYENKYTENIYKIVISDN